MNPRTSVLENLFFFFFFFLPVVSSCKLEASFYECIFHFPHLLFLPSLSLTMTWMGEIQDIRQSRLFFLLSPLLLLLCVLHADMVSSMILALSLSLSSQCVWQIARMSKMWGGWVREHVCVCVCVCNRVLQKETLPSIQFRKLSAS